MNAVNVHEITVLNTHTPEGAAAAVVASIHANLASPAHISANTICVIMRGFGHDLPFSETTSGPNATEQSLRFFTESDRLSGINDFTSFPAPRPNDGDMSARAYRHPFLRNTTTGGPMRAWMEDYVAAFNRYVDPNDALYDSTIPNPNNPAIHYRYYFDQEAWIATYGGPNAVFMLKTLAQSQAIWETWKVPGSPGWVAPAESELVNASTTAGFASASGMTAKAMYDAVRDAQIAFNSDPQVADIAVWPASITASGGIISINATHRADIVQNQPYMQWWYHVTKAAESAVLETSGYEILRAAWPGVICGNYDAARYDGTVDATSWFQDADLGGSSNYNLPRGWIDRQPAPPDAFFNRLNIRAANDSRWLNIAQTTTADRDSPFLYPLVISQMGGYPGSGYKGHAAANLYLPNPTNDFCYTCPVDVNEATGCVPWMWYDPTPNDPNSGDEFPVCIEGACGTCGEQNSLRLARHTVESIINSEIPGESGSHEGRLTVWLAQNAADAGNVGIDYYRDREQGARDQLAMLRGKNVPEFIFWLPGGAALQRLSWEITADLVKRVYAARVTGIKSAYGDVPAGYDAHDPAMLEYTLRDSNGLDKVATIRADLVQNEHEAGNPTQMLVAMDVFFELRMTALGGVPVNFMDGFNYDILLECAAGEEVTGKVLAWDFEGGPNQDGAWRYVPLREAGTNQYDLASPEGVARRAFKLIPGSSERFVEQDVTDDDLYHLRIRVLHRGAIVYPGGVPSWHHSSFDLLQVIPVVKPWDNVGGEEEEQEGLQSPLSDVNFDGVVGEADFEMFIGAWVGSQPMGDLNQDSIIDDLDVESFIGSYLEGTP